MVGTWKIAAMQPANLPQKVATAFTEVTSNLVGATYTPVLYCGEQLVHGTNHMIICKQVLAAQGAPEHLITMVINCSEQGNTIVKIEQII